MQLTERDAATKICPFAQGFNHGQRKCAASACMAWDFVDFEWEYYRGNQVSPYCGAAYLMNAEWPPGSLPLGSDWTWESSIYFHIALPLPGVEKPTSGWWRRPKADRLGQCGRTIILDVQTA